TLQAAARARLVGAAVVVQDAAGHARDTHLLAENLLQAFTADVVELHVHAPPAAAQAGERPVALAFARLRARDHAKVTNLRHEVITLDDLTRHLLCHLDGSRDRAALLEVLLRLVREQGMVVQQHGRPVTDAAQLRDALAEGLEAKLRALAHYALLLG